MSTVRGDALLCERMASVHECWWDSSVHGDDRSSCLLSFMQVCRPRSGDSVRVWMCVLWACEVGEAERSVLRLGFRVTVLPKFTHAAATFMTSPAQLSSAVFEQIKGCAAQIGREPSFVDPLEQVPVGNARLGAEVPEEASLARALASTRPLFERPIPRTDL